MQGPVRIVLGLIVYLARLWCPHQPTFADIPIVECDISKGLNGYQTTMRRKKLREKALSPFFIGYHHDIPVTPLPNPHTKLSSHHIIRLVNGTSGRYRVDLLIQDTDLYFVAFRRELVLTEEERQQGRAGGWGRWQRFDDAVVPGFLNARNIGIGLSYGKSEHIRPGGAVALENIYFTLGEFADNSVAGSDVKRAAYCTMTMFCEPSRLRCMYNEICCRIRDGRAPDILHESLWEKIKKWGQLCTVALNYQVNNLLQAQVDLPRWCLENHGLASVDSLVGAKGEVTLIKIDTLELGLSRAQLKEFLKADEAGNGPEPGFQQLQLSP